MVSNFFELIKATTGKTIKESIGAIKELVVSCCYNNKEILVAYKKYGVNIINNIIPTEDVSMEEKELYIYGENDFELHITKKIKEIKFEEINRLIFIMFEDEKEEEKEELTLGF